MLHHRKFRYRKSLRLQGYDYSKAGFYFITICVQHRLSLFGDFARSETQIPLVISNSFGSILRLNDAGKMVVFWYSELENKFPDIKCHEMVVMPDHFHCIIENTGSIAQGGVGADLCVCAYPCAYPDILNYPEQHDHLCDHNYRGEHKGSPLWRVIQWFKTMTTNEYIRGVKNYGWQRFENKLWQRNYWERIIRTENDMNRISEYIVNNPKNWIVKNNL